MSRILITGHKGYIGSHLFNAKTMEGCDLKDGTDFERWFSRQACGAVVHLAASVSVTESFEKPEEYFDNNCFKVIRFLERTAGKRFIFVSTGGAMYGNKRFAMEDAAKWENCLSPYAQSKYLAEVAVRQMVHNHVILRLANVYGGDTTMRGEAAVHAHFAEDNPITVYGGNQTRDFVHVDVVCEAIRRAIDSDVVGTFNIGSGEETRIKSLAEEFSAKRGVPILYKDARPGEVDHISLDSGAARIAGLMDFKEY